MIRIFLTILLLMSFAESFAGTYSGGAGTVGNPYQISTTADLIELSKTSADWASHFILTQDIAFNANEQLVDWDDDGTADWDAGDQLGFSPIGNNTTNFTGTFDGQGYEIDNLFIDRTSQNDVGLFGRTEASSQIKNLGVINAVITGLSYVGGLVGYNPGTVSNCYSTGSLTGYWYVGGLFGFNGGTVSNCYSTGSVTGDVDVGGLVGENNGGTVSNCYSTGNVSGNNYVGGIVGFNTATVSNCYSTGSVSGNNYVGGLVGFNTATVSNCYSTGSVNGSSDVGGLVGSNNGGTVSNCYSTGNVSGILFVGGLVGWNLSGTVSNCYSTGSVTGEIYVGGLVAINDGGLVGINDGTVSNSYSTGSVSGDNFVGGLVGCNLSGTVSNCFWDTQTSSQENSAGGTERTTAQMKTQSTFTDAGWDFLYIWRINSPTNVGYPSFAW